PHRVVRCKWQERERPPCGGRSGLHLVGRSLFGFGRLVGWDVHLLARLALDDLDVDERLALLAGELLLLVDDDRRPGAELAAEDEVGERILREPAGGAAPRPCTP